jgi:hypothetical protein
MACRLVALCMTLLLQQHTLPGLPFRPRSPDWLKMKNPGLCGGEAGSGRGLEPIAKNPAGKSRWAVCCRLCVCCCALGPRPVVGAAPICTLVGDRRGAPGADLTASVDLTAFERCDRRHRSTVRQRFIFWTTHPRRRRAAKHTPPRPIAPAARGSQIRVISKRHA